MYKLVDNLNGWASNKVHKTKEEALQELEQDKEQFYDNMINRDCLYCKTIVSANAQRIWNGYDWVWEE